MTADEFLVKKYQEQEKIIANKDKEIEKLNKEISEALNFLEIFKENSKYGDSYISFYVSEKRDFERVMAIFRDFGIELQEEIEEE